MNFYDLNDRLITNGQLTGGASLNHDERAWYKSERLWNCDPPTVARKRHSLGALLHKLLGREGRAAQPAPAARVGA